MPSPQTQDELAALLPFSVTIQWGAAPELGNDPITYRFATQAELDAFLQGVDAMDGWLGYTIIEPGETDALTNLNGPVSITLDTPGNESKLVARFETIEDAEEFLNTSATIDPDDLEAGNYSISAPHGVGNDDEAASTARKLGFSIFASMGGYYYAPRGVAITGNVNGTGWSKSYTSDGAAALAALATVEP